ncbi:aminotransferase class V-fold PLP-dependent enzyme [Legionella quateirensis]|uniref:Selenocysteine lyase, PLP-dependent n=1 Tax=Legionella quateirensis TaxID=45072 RepID=A0A378KTN3_9GAMM|nr:aminotransferase class V-fold PLP-dependent enzyme [Legionella quateirensis]KTD50810.1 selenocysteine lyase, PLP-dependent [Legionella quateirensis]STY17945.1 selenocysteine lyase, PLP-dependent [Legionella quateirensis]
MTLNINQLRNDTPGCQNVLHFNNAGASLPTLSVMEAVKKHLDLEANIGGYEAAHLAEPEINNFYKSAAQLINCSTDEIAFMENATRAWDMAFYSLRLKKGDRILTAVCEYASNYIALLHKAQTTGVIIDVIPNDDMGQLDVTQLESKIDDKVKLIAITHVPTNGGLINPAELIGTIARKYNIPYLLDTTQSIGQMPIDVKTLGCDFLCATGRKYLRGPRGTGFLYAGTQIIDRCDPPFLDLHSAKWLNNNSYEILKNAQRFETWEQYIAGKIGLTAAIDYALNLDINLCWQRILDLAALLRSKLASIPGIQLHDLGSHQCGIVTFTHSTKSAQEVQNYLSSLKINTSVSLLEYTRLDMAGRNLSALLRASVHYYNTEEEIERFSEEIERLK